MIEAGLDTARLAVAFLRDAESLMVLSTDDDGVVRFCNDAMAAALGREGAHLVGSAVFEHLIDTSAQALRDGPSAAASPEPRVRLTFVDADGVPFTLSCHVQRRGGGRTIWGERAARDERALCAQLMQMNGELATLAREHERARRALARAIEERDRSHWHLEKIQEALPICMFCEQVKGAGDDWQSLVGYLRDNDVFVSHGLCATCVSELDEVVEVAEEIERVGDVVEEGPGTP